MVNKEDINISGKNKNKRSIWIQVYLYEVCLSRNIYSLRFHFMTILIPFFKPDLWYLYHYGRGVQKVLVKRVLVGRGKFNRAMVEVKVINRWIH